MNSEMNVRQLEDLFRKAIAVDPSHRTSFLDQACAGQPQLRALIDGMLSAECCSGTFADAPMEAAMPELQPGDSVGRWQIREKIGSGGLGHVYHAFCDADGVMMEAAVKVLKPGLGAALRERFVQERLILVGLDHPFIARLIDAGVGSCGTSFMAMEFVEGSQLHIWLEQRNRSVTERIELFGRICEAVAYLHDNMVVHGDLKPGNVVIKGDGTPRLLDFGAARLVTDSETHGTLTRWMMTPGYASPEQLAGLGPSPVGDVFSLGCIFQEMFQGERLSSDLTSIQNKCLARDTNQRYASARAIAEDLTRFREHFPVRARRATLPYVAGKFLRRNWISCALAAVLLVSLIVGCTVSRVNLKMARQDDEQRRSMVSSLVRDHGQQRPEPQQRMAFVAGVEDSIAQMERMNPPPFADLASAWRRISYSQAARGETPKSLESIDRAIWWARRFVREKGSEEARVQLAESLLYASTLHQRRANYAQAGRTALEAIRLADTLPGARLTSLERIPHFVYALGPASRVKYREGDVGNARALLVRAVRLAGALSKSTQLRFMLALVRMERAARNSERAGAWCVEATALGISDWRLHRLCGTSAPVETEEGLSERAAIYEQRLMHDPERYGDRLHWARLELQIARKAAQRGDTARSHDRLDKAHAVAADLLKADPENRLVRRLMKNIARAQETNSASAGTGGQRIALGRRVSPR